MGWPPGNRPKWMEILAGGGKRTRAPNPELAQGERGMEEGKEREAERNTIRQKWSETTAERHREHHRGQDKIETVQSTEEESQRQRIEEKDRREKGLGSLLSRDSWRQGQTRVGAGGIFRGSNPSV